MPASKPDARPLSPRQDQFCREYLVDLNATQAALRAGYAHRCADQQASRLLHDPRIAARIAALKTARAGRLEVSADDVVRRLALIAFADVRRMVALQLVPCRHCHGQDHAYHWTSAREWREACAAAKAAGTPAPGCEGGFGYSRAGRPHPDCPDCGGQGVPHMRYRDCAEYGPAEAALFQGLKVTRTGIELRLADQMRALQLLGEHLGLFDTAKAPPKPTAFEDMLKQLLRNGSKAPIVP